jgi:hypothetical protein
MAKKSEIKKDEDQEIPGALDQETMDDELKDLGKSKKYSRRSFLKYMGRIGIGASVGGYIGNIFGRGYQWGKDTVGPYAKKGKEIIDKGEDAKDWTEEKLDDAGEWMDKTFNKKEYERRKKAEKQREELRKQSELEEKVGKDKKMDRRGFIKYLMRMNDKPERVATTTGAMIGGGISAYRNLGKYLSSRDRAKLKDDKVTDKEEKEIIKKAIRKMENSYKKMEEDLQGQIDLTRKERKQYLNENVELKGEIEELKEMLKLPEKKESGLEKKVDEKDKPGSNTSLAMIIGGLILGLSTVAMLPIKHSGFAILGKQAYNIHPVPIIILTISATLILIGTLLNKIKK